MNGGTTMTMDNSNFNCDEHVISATMVKFNFDSNEHDCEQPQLQALITGNGSIAMNNSNYSEWWCYNDDDNSQLQQ